MSTIEETTENAQTCFLLRCGAAALDYTLLILPTIIGLLIARAMGNDGAKLFRSAPYNIGLTISFFVALANFFLLPIVTGQSIGKMVTGLKIVKKDGTRVDFKQILIRHLVGYPLDLLTAGFGFLIAVFNSQERALHDYISGTRVDCSDNRKF